MKINKFLVGTLAFVLIAGLVTPVFASLVGDTVHVFVVNSNNEIGCDTDVVVIDPGVEISNCMQLGIDIDLDGDSIWFLGPTFNDGDNIVGITYEFTNLNWVNNPSGIITGVQLVGPNTIPLDPVVFDDHSITISHPPSSVNCGSPPSCVLEWHIDIQTDHTVGGEFLPIDSTALLIAGMSANLSLIVPIAAGIAGVGAYYIRSRMNKE